MPRQGVRAALLSARRAVTEGHTAAAGRLTTDVAALFASADAAEGVRRPARFDGR